MGMKISQYKRIGRKLMDCLIPGHSRIKTYITGRAWKPVICFYFQQSKDDSINNIVEIPTHRHRHPCQDTTKI